MRSTYLNNGCEGLALCTLKSKTKRVWKVVGGLFEWKLPRSSVVCNAFLSELQSMRLTEQQQRCYERSQQLHVQTRLLSLKQRLWILLTSAWCSKCQKDNSDSNTNSTNLTWFLLCNNKSVTDTHTQHCRSLFGVMYQQQPKTNRCSCCWIQ